MLGLTPPASVRAILALIEMAARDERVRGNVVEDRLGLPERGLEAALQLLASGGILDSAKGRKGGYKLVRSDVTLKEIVLALRPALDAEPKPLPKQVRSALEEAEQAYLIALSKVTISSLAPR